jgi:hypothetical protein
MRAQVVFESMFGNTETIARAVADGLATRIPVEVVEVGEAPQRLGDDVGLLVVGGPTHAFGMSRPQTRISASQQAVGRVVSGKTGIREWISGLSSPAPLQAVAFDTRIDRSWVPGSAARAAQRRLARKGWPAAGEPHSFFVRETPGPLADGEIDRARRWGEELGARFVSLVA